MADERNFRSSYYEKFGFRGIEEKKSVELLLKDKPLDVTKLRLYCLRFPVSARYRFYLWKIILDILPANQESHEFVMKNREEQYDQLRHALDIMRRVEDTTPQPMVFLKMFLIEEGMLPFQDNELTGNKANVSYTSIARTVCNLVENPVDSYWIATQFYRVFRKNYIEVIPQLVEKTKILLKKEDGDQKLWNQLEKHDIWSNLPLLDWFNSCFAGVLPDFSFGRIGDIVLGGSIMILVYVAVAIFLTLRRPLLIMNMREEMLHYLTQIPEDSGDILVNKAIDMWEKHGYHLAKFDSPGPVSRSPT